MPVNINESVKPAGGRKILHRFIEGLILAALLILLFNLTGRILCRIAIAQIGELTNTKITTKSVDLSLNGSVLIRGLVIRPGYESNYDNVILKAQIVHARFGIGSMMMLHPKLKKITIRDFVFDVQHDLDGDRWNLAAMKIIAPKGEAGQIPLIGLKGGLLQYSRISQGKSNIVIAVSVDAKLEPDEKTQGNYNFTMITAGEDPSRRNTLNAKWQSGKVSMTGGISSENIPESEQTWKMDVMAAEMNYGPNKNYALNLTIKDLFSTQKPVSQKMAMEKQVFLPNFGLFSALNEFFDRCRFRGHAGIEFQASGNFDELSKSTLTGKVHCKGVSIAYRDFPYPVEHITGQVDFTEKSVTLNDLHGGHGDVELIFNGWSKDFGADWKYHFQIKSDNMALDGDLYNAMDKDQRRLWDSFSPQGKVAIDYDIKYLSETDEQNVLTAELLNIQAAYRNLPYPLRNLTGKLIFEQDNLNFVEVVSHVDGGTITFNGKAHNISAPQPTYDVGVKADNIPLDSTFAAAISNKETRRVTVPETNAPAVKNKASITGRIWTEKEGSEGRYSMSVKSEQMELNEELLSMLPDSAAKVVTELQAKGKVNLNAEFGKTDSNALPDYTINLDCLNNSINYNKYPYPLKDITGRLTITKNGIGFHNITAIPEGNIQTDTNAPSIKINGQLNMANDVFGDGWFTASANDIALDERLGVAMPEDIKPIYRKLSPTGRFDLNFENIKISAEPNDGKYIDFAGLAKLKGCGFNMSPAISDLDATMQIKGEYKTGQGLRLAQSSFIAERLKIKGKSLTDFISHITYEPNEKKWTSENISAYCYGGILTGKLELRQSAQKNPEYMLQVGFNDINLREFLADNPFSVVATLRPVLCKNPATEGGNTLRSTRLRRMNPSREPVPNDYTSGKLAGTLSVGGQVGDDSSKLGRCMLNITDMEVGNASPLAKLLYILNLTEPKDFIFDRMLIDSYIKGENLSFEKFDLSGEAIAFNGSGSMNLQKKDVELVLTARGKRLATAEPGVMQSLTDSLRGAVVRVDVSGNIYDPQIETTPLPVLKDTLGILGTKMKKSKN